MKTKCFLTINLIIDNFLSFCALFVRLNKNTIIFNSTHNTNYNFNSKYLFEYMTNDIAFIEKSREKLPELRCYFIINDDNKRQQLLKDGLVNIINTKSLRYKWLCLTAMTWVCSTIETPIFSVFKKKYRIVYHLGHGIPLKKIGLAETNINRLQYINRYLRVRMFTHVTCFSEYFKDVMAETFGCSNLDCPKIINTSFNLLKFGQPRNDCLSITSEIAKVSQEKDKNILSDFSDPQLEVLHRVLYCPTWRDYSTTIFFPFSDMDINKLNGYLESTKTILYIREHPYYRADIDINILNLPRVVNLDSNKVSDINLCLNYFDQLITDYSSIFIDFMALDRRVVFVPYDLSLYQNKVGFSKPYMEIAIGDYVDSLDSLLSSLCKQNDDYEQDRKKVCNELNLKISGNCKEHADYLLSLLSE